MRDCTALTRIDLLPGNAFWNSLRGSLRADVGHIVPASEVIHIIILFIIHSTSTPTVETFSHYHKPIAALINTYNYKHLINILIRSSVQAISECKTVSQQHQTGVNMTNCAVNFWYLKKKKKMYPWGLVSIIPVFPALPYRHRADWDPG